MGLDFLNFTRDFTDEQRCQLFYRLLEKFGNYLAVRSRRPGTSGAAHERKDVEKNTTGNELSCYSK